MAIVTNQTLAQTSAALVTAGALPDQATAALHSAAWQPGKMTVLWGALVKCTSGWNSGDPKFSYDISPT
jgi:hypothetical protein